MPIEHKGKTIGRKKGVPNKVTAQVRAKFQDMFERLGPKVEKWINEVAQSERRGEGPAVAASLVLQLAEYHVPKLSRSELKNGDDGPLKIVIENATPKQD